MLWKCCTHYASKFGKHSSAPQDWKRSVFIPIPKKNSAKECSNYRQLWSFLMLVRLRSKSFKLGFSSNMNWELLDVQAGFRKGRGARDQTPDIHWIIEKAREFQKKHLLLLYWLHKSLCMDHNKLWKIFKEMGIPDHLPVSWETWIQIKKQQIRTLHGTDWFKIGKGVQQGYILSPCLFNFYGEYITWHSKLDESQAGIKIIRRNINNLRYADGI